MKTITFNIEDRDGSIERAISIDTLVIAGWTGRDVDAMEKHIRELEELGIKRPAYTRFSIASRWTASVPRR